MSGSGRERPVGKEWYERDDENWRGQHESATRWPGRGSDGLFPAPLFATSFFRYAGLSSDDVRELLPYIGKPDRRPHSPGGKTPDVEIISITHFVRAVTVSRILRPAVLEVQIVDERQRHREHERTEIPERFSISIPMPVTAEEPEHEEQECERKLKSLMRLVCVAEPLPLEVQPPHSDLRRVGRAALELLTVLLAVDVGHQPLLRETGEGAARLDLCLACSRRAFVYSGKVGGAHRFKDEWRQPDDQRAEPGEDELPAKDRPPASHEHGYACGGKRKESSRMVRVAESEEEANEDDEAIRAG